jgi:large subunit ribosomal protein L13
MSDPVNKTYSTKASEIQRDWWLIDADGAVLGRLAAQAAHILRGKHKPTFTPHLDTGDYVVVINAEKVRLTGNKLISKIWYRHSGYPGALREIGYDKLMSERPTVAVEKAVKGMLPHNSLGRTMGMKLKVYTGADHPHSAQNPKPLEPAGKQLTKAAGE